MQSPAATAEGFSGPLFETYTLPTFKFQPRRESIDWRRINALDVDRVAQELDVATLQENIAGVTFCNLNQEVCSRCGQPVDPVLLKVLRLAQLIIEYLLHCQDCLSARVAQLEARLQASLGQQQRGQQELGRQADELKGVREESRRRRKMISTLQQLLMQTGAHNYHACHLCDKTFMNATFLRGHIQRRHAGSAEGGKQKQQERPAEELVEELRAKLRRTEGELEAQREAERRRQLQEAEITRQREIEVKKEFDEWKEEERTKLYGEIDKLKQLLWDEFKTVANQNSTLAEKLQALQSHTVTESNLGSLRDEESEERLRQAQELQALREKLETQKTEWKRKLKELQEERVTERRELQEENERLQASLSQDQRKAATQAQRQINALHAQLREQARLIASQEEKIQTLSLRKTERIQELPKAVDTEEDSPEEELEDSQDEQQHVLAALRRNPPLLKQFRPILEDTLEEKLESLGIQRDAKGIAVQTLRHLESVLKAQREQKARKFSEFLRLRKKLIKEATSRMKERQNGEVLSQLDGQPPAKSQWSTLLTREVRPKTGTLHVALPSKLAEPFTPALQSRSSHGPGPTQVSAPTPRPRRHRPSSTPVPQGPGLSSTPPFSSEEDSEENAAHRSSLQTPRVPSKMVPQQEKDWDWSDTESSEGNAQRPDKGSGGLSSSGTLVQSMVKNLEKQLEAPAKKPAGGVRLFLRPNTGPERAAVSGRKPQLSEDESDLEISSLEDLSQDLDQREKPKPLSRSKLPEKIDASAWTSGRPRVPGW
ncbi:PREDICTED: zinc finger protein DZIP1L isoform X1 [Chinchilla lanigera]|nr:PREDICTED: zinc finger protein DZIP1L isoform X1 [Chinchilla lanigera]XP_005406829.1 PREDICTED: zinc finger protein DZIP1L isoform X1 [Chinchilla lanigera]XP_013361219.1 PREDICTED: zinc finger protein DZIP1L isoform X1 [Chinchilla lanigera]XP_013361220.1 PREDICTED: zinc finger protein DZIP1L isoform X1 [Chinchilla lanigera]XP_013361221.1 PREDICTED: zinc finger protein DZIP1L isoform X1 [Chinchilla lanigera]XP_013361222.1 PREDICTED: zinc finger protein DZIP1L isoform X1 [Chinchilla lanigera]